MDSEYKSFIKIFITGCLWGTIGLFVKLMEAQGSSSPYTSFLRLLFGFILLALMTLIIDGPKAFCIGRRTLLSCVLLGIICQGIFNILYSTSIRLIRERQAEYAEYRKVRADRTEFIRAKQNADVILRRQQEERDEKMQEKL